MAELWQLYNEQGCAMEGKGAKPDDIFGKGLLHGAAHVWIWRIQNGVREVLLQKRASTKRTWPDKYDISAAGHIDLGEEPLTAAIRETREEIGLDIADSDLQLVSVQKVYMTTQAYIENEFQWLYLLLLDQETEFTRQRSEVGSLEWKSLEAFKPEVINDSAQNYVPHGRIYFETVIAAVEAAS